MERDYKDKIKKLLALAQSPNIHEAKAALLKARQMMAEHKLSEADLGEPKDRGVKTIWTDITCSKRKNPWAVCLSGIIGDNYCCIHTISNIYRKQRQYIGFIGLEDDVDICRMVFEYAIDCIMSESKRIRKENKSCKSGQVSELCMSYGYGFTAGVAEAFRKQQEENSVEWGLIMKTPKEVQEEVEGNWESVDFTPKKKPKISKGAYLDGYADGEKFDPSRRLGEDEPTMHLQDMV